MFGFLNRGPSLAAEEVLARLQRRVPHLLSGTAGETRMSRLPLDSMDVVELLCATEDEFGVGLTTAEFMRARTVNDLLRIIARRAPKAGHALR